MRRPWTGVVLSAALVATVGGCTAGAKLAQKDAEIATLQEELQAQTGLTAQALEEQRNLRAELAEMARRERVHLETIRNFTILRFPDQVLFPFGEATLGPKGRALLDEMAKVLVAYPDFEIRVEGHADNRPIADVLKEAYPTNWELSSGRAMTVVHYLIDTHKIPPRRFLVVGRGEHHPIQPNTTRQGRSANRRVEVLISHVFPVKALDS